MEEPVDVARKLREQADLVDSEDAGLAALMREAAGRLAPPITSDGLPASMSPLYSPDEPEIADEPTISPDCCTEATKHIFLATQTVDGRRVPTDPDAWYLICSIPPMKATYGGEAIENPGGSMSILIRYCPYCGSKLDPTRED